jgi:hypothetical protein
MAFAAAAAAALAAPPAALPSIPGPTPSGGTYFPDARSAKMRSSDSPPRRFVCIPATAVRSRSSAAL